MPTRMRTVFAAALVCLGCSHVSSGTALAPIERAALPSYSEQVRTREAWLAERHGLPQDREVSASFIPNCWQSASKAAFRSK
jgi:hypothetical protein